MWIVSICVLLCFFIDFCLIRGQSGNRILEDAEQEKFVKTLHEQEIH